MKRADRVHRTLRAEELEPRVAPAIVPGVLTIDGTAGDDVIILQDNGIAGDGTYEIIVNGGPVVSFTGFTELIINGGDGDDTLTVDLSGENPIPIDGLTYNGGGNGAGGDSLVLTGGAFANEVVNYINPTDGTIDLDTSRITFTGLEPIIDTVAAGTYTVNATDGANVIALDDGSVGGDGQLRVTIDAFEPIEFANKTNLIINSGDGVAGGDTGDVVTVNCTENATGLTTITVNGDEGNDVINVQFAPPLPVMVTLNINGNDGDDTITVDNVAVFVTVNVDGGAAVMADALIVNAENGQFDPMVVLPTGLGIGTVDRSSYGGAWADVNYAGIEAISLVGQLADGDPFGVDGTAGDDVFQYFQGVTPDTGVVQGTMNGGAFALPFITFTGMDQASDLVFNVFGAQGGNDVFEYHGTAQNELITFDGADTVQSMVGPQLFSNIGIGTTSALTIYGEDGDDALTITPSTAVPVTADGGNGTDTFTYVGPGTPPAGFPPDPNGVWTQAGMQDVTVANCEAGVLGGVILSTLNPRYTFTDADGDQILLIYRGPGQAGVTVIDGSDITSIDFAGTTDRTLFMMKDLDPRYTPNTMIAGTVQTAGNESLKMLQFINPFGRVQNTDITVGGDLDVLLVKSALDTVNLDIGGALGKGLLVGGMADSTVTVGGTTNMLKAMNGQVNSALTFTGDARMVMLRGGMDDTAVDFGANASRFMCMGEMVGGSTVHVTGTTDLFRVTGGIAGGSTVDMDGDASKVFLFGAPGEASVAAGCTVTLGNDLTGRLIARGEMAGVIDIEHSAQDVKISIIGNLTGDLLSGVFGNVTVCGNFSGNIGDGDTAGGMDNLLKVTVPGGPGVVTPANAFARYIGYTP